MSNKSAPGRHDVVELDRPGWIEEPAAADQSPPLGGRRRAAADEARCAGGVAYAPEDLVRVVRQIRHPLLVVRDDASQRVGLAISATMPNLPAGTSLIGVLPPVYPEWLGDREFCESHSLRFPYVTGSMANGIAAPALVVAVAKAGMLAFFGAAGLSFAEVERGLSTIEEKLSGTNAVWGANLIHSPYEAALERRVAELYIAKGVRKIEASAFMKIEPSVVRYALHGLSTDPAGHIVRKNSVFAKVSRPEVARQFMMPAPPAIVSALLESDEITAREAELARRVAVAEDITVEADSGGHTDNRPLTALFPEIVALRDQLTAEYRLERPVRVGAAGGIGTPLSVAAAFAMGAAYVLTGSINQACRESGLSAQGRNILAGVGIADVMMAPAADMFELGVNLQVVKRGSMFGPRAKKLYALYDSNPGLTAIVGQQRAELEKIFGQTVEEVWAETEQFWARRDAVVLERAARDPKYQMGLVFRWYLGKSSRWAIEGVADRRLDYQIWCGPAMGAFNSWVRDSFLESPENREVVQVALNLLEGAAQITMAQRVRDCGVRLPAEAFRFKPRRLAIDPSS
ncbi:PfaD family polyunsaturated fatty acid/polyketide biosynthesis protein [Mycobacterium intermedium]|uniref:PfaD family polyunsaturated fatty acid/polyketide biosynthesis protein n=2 Tax=Mycobacterium intermedium TaxID=28445 RepID=UPI0018D4B9B5|nr:PfaD family polyunsaturated fatty acid/polyketide biosynthesis protein [Mycobacterium intermedium]